MATSKNLLIIFYRNPELGKVKTRLAATLGNEKALAIYLQLAAYTHQITQRITANTTVYYSHTIEMNDVWPTDEFKKEVQKGELLGERMEEAFRAAFNKDYEKVCVIGTDCLELTTEIIEHAFDALTKTDVVLGPAKDGGYYLIGMKKLYIDVFVNKHWSTHTVTHDTLLDLERLALSYTLLPLLSDIDVEEDLKGKLI